MPPHARDTPATAARPILDLYAGAGGWDVGAQILGLSTVGLELAHDPCVTAVKAGHPRVRCDIATYPTGPFAGRISGLVVSPPCQAWSMAGNRLGEQDKVRVHKLVDRYAAGDPTAHHAWAEAGWVDPRSHHAAQPVRWIRDLLPPFVCLEQVPPVIDLWRHIGNVLRGWGYSVSVQVLCAADYGVPQTRERAILIATRTRPALIPDATHERDPRPGLFGERLPWVSMADALGWNGAVDRHTNSKGPRGTMTPTVAVPTDRSAPTLTGKSGTQWVLSNGSQPNATNRTADEPAGTIYCSRPGNLHWTAMDHERGAGLIERHGDRKRRATGEPAFTITAGSKGSGTRLIFCDDDATSRQVALHEAAILQSFPASYPWHGNKTSTFMQVGNAVPPRLATAVIGAAAGIDWQAAVDRFYGSTEAAA